MTDTERKRLVAVLGMLGSASSGERDNAARLAEQLRRQHGMTWDKLFADPVVVERVVEVERVVYVDRIVYTMFPYWKRFAAWLLGGPQIRVPRIGFDGDRLTAIACGAIPIIIVLASLAPKIRAALGY